MIWIYQFADYEAFKYAGEFMINTNDGYYWAEGARDILSGVSQSNDLSPINATISILTAFFAKILPFSFETIILYMPVYLSSLIVIPIILLSKNLNNLEMGLIASLLASIAWSYYNRTMVGYFDTDMLNIVLPMFLLYSIVVSLVKTDDKYLLLSGVFILIYRWWYPASYALNLSFLGILLLYILIYDRKNNYGYKLLSVMLLCMVDFHPVITIVLLAIYFVLFKMEKSQKYIYPILALLVVIFFVNDGFSLVISKLNGYVFKESVRSVKDGLNLHFFTVMQTIKEAGNIPFDVFANRISGDIITFVFSVIGYIYLVYRHRIMILALPMVGLGFLASVAGLRFTIYSVAILAMGIAFLITELSAYMPTKKLKYLFLVIFSLLILVPNYQHIESYRVPTVFNSKEVATLEILKNKASRDDYVVAWWDYGYPIRYYADVKTLIDGGKHSGSVNFPVSFILTNSQDVAAKMARFDVEYTESNFKKKRPFSNIEQMSKDYGFDDTNDFLLSLQTDIKLPKKTRDIYFYLPYKMLDIYPTVKLFSNLDLMNGEKHKYPFFYISRNFKNRGDLIQLSESLFLNKKDLSLMLGNEKATIKRFVQTSYDKQGRFKKDIQLIDFKSKLSVIFMSSYNTFLVVDEATYNSLYIQLMVLEEYDKTLFEKITFNPYAKIYKLRI
jgi:dolichyl-diphosphooligosaccharide--protein glycosyltransferase/undecaprenyl-diphosphooligosaccharide--protein glycosyltransferase